MNTTYGYFRNHENRICRIHVEEDSIPLNPRKDWDGNIGHLMVWWNRYNLGDENDYSDAEYFINDMIRKHVADTTIINYIKAKKTSNGLELKYNRKDQLWELWGYWKVWWTGSEVHHGVIESNYPIDFLVDDMIEALSMKDKIKLLERAGFEFLPVFVIEHSMISISTHSYGDPWDSGCAGYIYTSKDEIIKTEGKFENVKGNYEKVTKNNWRKAAVKWMAEEVAVYDMYLQNECYGYEIEELDMDDQSAYESKIMPITPEDFTWNETTDSCWGFFSSNYGWPLVKEIAAEGIGITDLKETVEELVV